MAYSDDVELWVNQTQILNLVPWWYSFPDAAFQTGLQDITASPAPDRGWCIRSATYETQSVVVEFFEEAQSIVAVLHASGLCGYY